MKGILVTASAIFLSLLLQTTLLANLKPKPDGVLAVILTVSFLRGPLYASACGFFGGLAEDALSGASKGGFCLTGVLVGWVMGSLFKRLNSGNFIVLFLGSVLGSLLHFFIFGTLASLPGWLEDFSFHPPLLSWLLVQSLLCVAFLTLSREWFSEENIRL